MKQEEIRKGLIVRYLPTAFGPSGCVGKVEVLKSCDTSSERIFVGVRFADFNSGHNFGVRPPDFPAVRIPSNGYWCLAHQLVRVNKPRKKKIA